MTEAVQESDQERKALEARYQLNLQAVQKLLEDLSKTSDRKINGSEKSARLDRMGTQFAELLTRLATLKQDELALGNFVKHPRYQNFAEEWMRLRSLIVNKYSIAIQDHDFNAETA